MKTEAHSLLQKIKAQILAQDSKASVYLFGSRARGNESSDSDWDILILLNREQLLPKDEPNFLYPLFDLEFETGAVINPLIYTRKEWNMKYIHSPLYQQVMRDAKPL